MSSRYERELLNALDALGWALMRAPSSGSATDRDLPDLLAGRPIVTEDGALYAEAWAIEHKSGSATTLYVDEDEVEGLRSFGDAFGAMPLLAARPTTQATGREHYLVEPEHARRTDGGNYGLPVAELDARAFAVVTPGDEPEIEVRA